MYFLCPTNSLQKPKILYICCIYVLITRIVAKYCYSNQVIGANNTLLGSEKLWVWHFVAKEINQGHDQRIKSIIWFSTVAAGLWPASTGQHDPCMIVRNCVVLCAGTAVRDYFKATESLREIWFALPHLVVARRSDQQLDSGEPCTSTHQEAALWFTFRQHYSTTEQWCNRFL